MRCPQASPVGLTPSPPNDEDLNPDAMFSVPQRVPPIPWGGGTEAAGCSRFQGRLQPRVGAHSWQERSAAGNAVVGTGGCGAGGGGGEGRGLFLQPRRGGLVRTRELRAAGGSPPGKTRGPEPPGGAAGAAAVVAPHPAAGIPGGEERRSAERGPWAAAGTGPGRSCRARAPGAPWGCGCRAAAGGAGGQVSAGRGRRAAGEGGGTRLGRPGRTSGAAASAGTSGWSREPHGSAAPPVRPLLPSLRITEGGRRRCCNGGRAAPGAAGSRLGLPGRLTPRGGSGTLVAVAGGACWAGLRDGVRRGSGRQSAA